jgi:hypothetical protein
MWRFRLGCITFEELIIHFFSSSLPSNERVSKTSRLPEGRLLCNWDDLLEMQ